MTALKTTITQLQADILRLRGIKQERGNSPLGAGLLILNLLFQWVVSLSYLRVFQFPLFEVDHVVKKVISCASDDLFSNLRHVLL